QQLVLLPRGSSLALTTATLFVGYSCRKTTTTAASRCVPRSDTMQPSLPASPPFPTESRQITRPLDSTSFRPLSGAEDFLLVVERQFRYISKQPLCTTSDNHSTSALPAGICSIIRYTARGATVRFPSKS